MLDAVFIPVADDEITAVAGENAGGGQIILGCSRPVFHQGREGAEAIDDPPCRRFHKRMRRLALTVAGQVSGEEVTVR